MATPYNPEWDDEFCARCLQLDDGCKCYEIDHGDELCPHCEETWCDASCEDKEDEDEDEIDLCPVCQDLPIPEFRSCSCWYCPCMTTNPAGLMVCSFEQASLLGKWAANEHFDYRATKLDIDGAGDYH